MFGFGRQNAKNTANVLVSAVLSANYEFHYRRPSPPELAKRLVELAFKMGPIEFGGRKLATPGPVMRAAEALQIGYGDIRLDEEARAACAGALMSLIQASLKPQNRGELQAYEYEFLVFTLSSLQADQSYQKVRSSLPWPQAS